MAFKPALRFLFYAIFTCAYLAICPVVGLYSEEFIVHWVNTTNSTNSTSEYYFEFSGNRSIWGLWGEKRWKCEDQYNQNLVETTEFNKWGSNAATTIIALLPTLMAFAPIITANIGFLCHLSTAQGFVAAAFTFGLPVSQLDTWDKARIKVKELLGGLPLCHENASNVLRPFSETVDILLPQIKAKRPRYIWVQVLRFVFGLIQAVLIWLLFFFVPEIDTFNLVWVCPELGSLVFSVWLGVTFIILGWLRARFERDSFEGGEVIYISPSSDYYWRRFLDPHPMIVILRPSNDASEKEPCWTNYLYTKYFMGMFQLFWLCVLSFILSSTIGGTLFWTLIRVVVFITIVSMSRGFGILVCWLAQRYLDLRVIEYDNLKEKKMVQRLLGGMTDVLVDIRCVSYKKCTWQESVEMYQRGYQLSCGNVTKAPNGTKQCPLHAKKTPRRDALIYWLMRMAGLGLTICWSGDVPSWAVTYEILNLQSLQIAIFTATFACMCLGRTKRLLICNCVERLPSNKCQEPCTDGEDNV